MVRSIRFFDVVINVIMKGLHCNNYVEKLHIKFKKTDNVIIIKIIL